MKHPLLAARTHPKHSLSSLLPYFKQRRIQFCSILIILLLLAAAFVSLWHTNSDHYIRYIQNVEVLSYAGTLRVAINDSSLDYVIHAEKNQRFCSSIDGRIAAFLTDTQELYLVHDRQIKKIADDVLHFEISSSGMGIAFAQKYAQQYALTLYDLKAGTRKEITPLLSNLDFSLSPDGQTVAYYTQMDGQDVLMYHSKSEEQIIFREKCDLVGLSNEGKQIYAVCPEASNRNILFSFNKHGKATELGVITSISCKFNEDHQQIMFYDNGKTMISINGRLAEMASSHPLYLVTALNSHSASDGNSITLPVTSLFGHIYTCSDGEATSAWLIQKDPEASEKLVSRVSGCTLDATAEYLYYIYDLSELHVMNIANGISRSYLLAEAVDTYAVTSDRSKIYFTSNGSLYCTGGKKNGTPQLIADDAASYKLAMSSSDVVYYLSGSDLYACKNGRKGDIAIRDIQSFYASPNGVVYILSADEIHAAYGKKHPNKILSAA